MKSHCDYKSHRLQKEEARKLVIEVLKNRPEEVFFSRHAKEELKKDGLEVIDAINVLSSLDAKILKDGEFEKGSYRYRLETSKMCVVVSFSSEGYIFVVTAWRKNR